MSTKNDPAFPIGAFPGLTKREAMATAAMQNLIHLLGATDRKEYLDNLMKTFKVAKPSIAIAKLSVLQADALLEALES